MQVWYQWAQAWPDDVHEGHAHALATLKEARKAMPDCVMLAFASADLEEQNSQVQRAREVYEVWPPIHCRFHCLFPGNMNWCKLILMQLVEDNALELGLKPLNAVLLLHTVVDTDLHKNHIRSVHASPAVRYQPRSDPGYLAEAACPNTALVRPSHKSRMLKGGVL